MIISSLFRCFGKFNIFNKLGKITEVEQGALIKNDDLQFNSSFTEHNDNEMVRDMHLVIIFETISQGA